MKTRIIAVLGGGHGGHTAAADLALAGYEVRLYESPQFACRMQKVMETGEIMIDGASRKGLAKLALVTTDMAEAVRGADTVFVIVPAFGHKPLAMELGKHVEDGQTIGILPGTFGSLVFARVFADMGVLDKVVLAETSTLPYDTRIQGPGHVTVHGLNLPLFFGVFPSEKTDETLEKLYGLFKFTPVSDVLECGLHSLNPVLHTPGCIMNTGRIERSRGEFWLYEEGFTPTIARVTEALDCERMAIARAFGYDPKPVSHALSGGREPRSLWEEVNGSTALTPIKGPSSITNRYFTEDTPNGLVPWSLFGDLAGVETPLLDGFIEIEKIVIQQDVWKDGRTLEEMGIAGMDMGSLKEYLRTGKK